MTGNDLRNWKQRHGWTTQQIADATGVPRRTIEKWLSARCSGRVISEPVARLLALESKKVYKSA